MKFFSSLTRPHSLYFLIKKQQQKTNKQTKSQKTKKKTKTKAKKKAKESKEEKRISVENLTGYDDIIFQP